MNAMSKLKRGFTLIELMIVVAIIGVLAAMAIYGVRKYIANAKTSEARNNLGRIGKDSLAAFTRENMAGAVLSIDESVGISNRLCPDATPLPAVVPAAEKYQTDPSAWTVDAGWRCLRFTMQDPQYYQYDYTPSGTGTNGDGYAAIAIGDIDGDTELSTFQLSGLVQNGELTSAPTLLETNPEE